MNVAKQSLLCHIFLSVSKMNSEFEKLDFSCVETPCFLIEESLVRRNLELVTDVAHRSGAEIIMAFKAFSIWRLFDITRQFIPLSTASSLNEARMAFHKLGSRPHTYAPAYRPDEIGELVSLSSHITFNSLSQFFRYRELCLKSGVSCGIRINPEFSDVETDLYNPCAPGSRLGVIRDALPDILPDGVEGFHFHTLCESTSYDLERTLRVVEERFGEYFPRLKWINFGGGHLMTRDGYDVDHLVTLIRDFRSRYPWLQVILEPGSAHVWRTGTLVASVLDIVENHGIRTAILDVSFACHMPDCLEMPYQPYIVGAESIERNEEGHVYRMGGISCLSGDFVGYWRFDHELAIGERIVLEDMNHYTNVKTTMFNGVSHPSIALRRLDGTVEYLRRYTFDDYLSRMS